MNRTPLQLFFRLALALMLVTVFNGCKDDEENTPAQETGTATDVDGNIYKTVKIGNQWWFAENLRVKTYRNGNPIKQAQSETSWKDSSAAWCLYQDNTLSPGLLYNWFAVNDTGKIAPAGWHIPTDEEWKELERYLGMNPSEADKQGWRGTNEGNKLKVGNGQGWTQFGEVWATNESGFTALAGSCRLFNAAWGEPGLFSTGFWWSSSLYDSNKAMYRYLDYKNTTVFRSHSSMNYGFSVRCVKD